ncbi:MAG: orotate phosphoribosyltransferase [Bryobacteraceae bacterium]|nr:orotate phosphoribosyltransferase [Bryobacteraceae bacterium]
MTESEQQVLNLFRQTGAYLEGHFRLTSGLHSPNYLQCARVLQHPEFAERLGRDLAEKMVSAAGVKPGVVVSPAMGGLIIGHEVARALGCRHIFTEREGGAMTLRRGFSAAPDEVAFIVEDVITTGGSSLEVIDLLRKSGVRAAAAGSIIDRSGGRADLGIPRAALVTLDVVSWPPETCPLCAGGSPVVKPGSRA